MDRVTDWILPTACDNPEKRQEERSTNIRESMRRKKKSIISDSKESDIPLSSVATLSSSDLQMKGKSIHSRKGNPEGRRKN